MDDGTQAKVLHDDSEESVLAELGYEQQLDRRLSQFSNFAVSFSIISILTGGVNSVAQVTSGVGGAGMDNKVFPARSLKDAIGFDTKLGPVIVSISHQEQGTLNSVVPNAALGLGQGAAGSASQVGQRLTSLSGTYITGALVANLNFLTYDNRTDNQNTSYRDVLRAGAKYNFGSFQVGGGFSTLTTMSGGKLNSAAISAAVPVGALTLGANYATETAD